MVLFSTKFPVSSDFTQYGFLSMLRKYVLTSSEYHICPVFDNKISAEYIFEDNDEKLQVYRTSSYVAAYLSRCEGDKLFMDTYVLNQQNGVSMLFIRSEMMRKKMISEQMPLQRKVPALLQEIFWQEYGGMDNDILVDDKPILLRKTDIDLMQRLFVENQDFLMPILYVGLHRDTGKPLFDVNDLAETLAGVVHVVSPKTAYTVRTMETLLSDSCLQKFGMYTSVLILPNGVVQNFDSDVFKQEDIVSIVHDMSANVVIEDDFSFTKLRLNYLLANTSEDLDLSQICDELLREKDTIIDGLRDDLAEAERQIYNLKSKSEALSYSLGRNKADHESSLEIKVAESPFYEREIEDVILRILKKEYDAMKGDKNLIMSRKYHILKDIVEHNALTGKSDEIRAVFDEHMKDGCLNRDGISAVERMDFAVTKTGGGHYRIMYHDDGRYQIAMSSSPSDVRAGDNLVATYMNLLFGY